MSAVSQSTGVVYSFTVQLSHTPLLPIHHKRPNMNPSLNPDTPPPPPPKPSSHEVSRMGTPQTNQPLPPFQYEGQYSQDRNSQPGNGSQSPYISTLNYPNSQSNLPKPPTVEEGWLPDKVKDKSYAGSLLCLLLSSYILTICNLGKQDYRSTIYPKRPCSHLRALHSPPIVFGQPTEPSVFTEIQPRSSDPLARTPISPL